MPHDQSFSSHASHALIDLTGTDSEDDTPAEQTLPAFNEDFRVVALPRVDTEILGSSDDVSYLAQTYQHVNSTKNSPGNRRRTYANISSLRSDHVEPNGFPSKRRRVSVEVTAQGDSERNATQPGNHSVLCQGHPVQTSASKAHSQSSYMVSSRRYADMPHHHGGKNEDELMAKFLKDHLLPCVKEAVTARRERVGLSDPRLAGPDIFTKIAGNLIADLRFLRYLQRDGWRLSPASAKALYTKACRLTDAYAAAPEHVETEAEAAASPTRFRSSQRHIPEEVVVAGRQVRMVRDEEDHIEAALTIPSDACQGAPDTVHDDEALHIRQAIEVGQCSSPATSLSSVSDRITRSSPYNDSNTEMDSILPAEREHDRFNWSSKLFQHDPEKTSEESQASAPITKVLRGALDAKDIDIARRIHNMRYTSCDLTLPRPYIQVAALEAIKVGLRIAQRRGRTFKKLENSLLHVDFCSAEIKEILLLLGAGLPDGEASTSDFGMRLIAWMRDRRPGIANSLQSITSKLQSSEVRTLLGQRGPAAIAAFLKDASAGIIGKGKVVQMRTILPRSTKPRSSLDKLASLLRDRELGNHLRASRGLRSFKTAVSSTLEDTLVLQDEWTDCCGDIFTLSWTSGTAFVCGATAHSDYHNMQYNKPGNLLVGSTNERTLRAVPDHRIVRPNVTVEDNAENSTHSMRYTQDPWLYTSVVSSSYHFKMNYTFTGSFDHTVKVWNVQENGASMTLLGTWQHDAKVNFVLASEHHDLVATAVDAWNNAIRVYRPESSNIRHSPYDTYTGERACEQAEELQRKGSWAYFPATIQWGSAYNVAHLLLVGYSPRSVRGDDNDIPEDKRNTGELCIWNAFDKTKVLVSTARTQNVFEVIWHPTQPVFYAATTPCGIFESDTKTQINIFAQSKSGAFIHIKALECPASDINELTVMPNSSIQCYVTASCTDGNTYVWDTSQGDRAIHVLGHGKSLESPLHDLPREVADIGVKFAAWGKTSDRFYTGSSDGKLKSWDVKAPRGEAFIKCVLTASAGILVGKFSKDFSKLLVGDATGTVHLLAVDDEVDAQEAGLLPQKSTVPISLPRPKLVIPHPEPEPPESYNILPVSQTARDIAQAYLDNGQIVLHPDPTRGAVQGPLYHNGHNFRPECHFLQDPTQPLLPEWEVKQQYHRTQETLIQSLSCLPEMQNSDNALHQRNISLDFDFSRLAVSTQAELIGDRVELEFEEEPLEYELVNPRFSIFRGWRKKTDSVL